MSSGRLAVRVGRIELKNPLICGAGEQTMGAAGMRALLDAGAAAVCAKSANESPLAKQQLDGADYALLDSAWNPLPWDGNPPPDAQVFCRSGLVQERFEPWLDKVAALDRAARGRDAYVVASLILADLDECVRMAKLVEQAGVRVLELNVGAPHADEAAAGAIVSERSSERLLKTVKRVKSELSIPLWIKLTGQSEDVAGLALAAKEGGADAVVLMGRFLAMVPDVETRAPLLGTMAALGGPWGLALTCRWLALARRKVGKDYPLLGTNGARSGLDIVRFLLAGASAVEMTSAVMAGGSAVVEECLLDFKNYLEKQKTSAQQLVGEAADKLQSYEQQPGRPGHWKKFVPPGMLGD